MRKVKFIACAVAAFALAAFVLVGCSSGGSSSSSASSAATSEDFTLVVGFDAEYPPYGFMAEDGTYTGFDLDLAKAVCDELGWEFEAEPIDWDAKDALLNSGTINCIWNGFTMEGREGDYAFTDPYMLNEQVVVVKADSNIAALADLAGATVLTQAGSAAEEVLSADGDQAELGKSFGELVTIADYNNAFMQLESGAVDAVACDLSIAQYQMSANPGTYVMLTEPLSSEHYAVGFALSSADIADTVTDALKDLDASGEVKTLCQKYEDYGLTYDNWVL